MYISVGVSLCSDLKIIVLGASNVGKTCLLQRYISNTFSETESVRDTPVSSIAFILCSTDYRRLLGNEKMGQSQRGTLGEWDTYIVCHAWTKYIGICTTVHVLETLHLYLSSNPKFRAFYYCTLLVGKIFMSCIMHGITSIFIFKYLKGQAPVWKPCNHTLFHY